MLKTCTSCRKEKPLECFRKGRQSKGLRASRGGMGVYPKCKECAAELRKPGILKEKEARQLKAEAGVKWCKACALWQPVAEFHVRRKSSDGLAFTCMRCVAERCAAWRQKNPGAFSEWHKQNSEHRSEYFRQWREKNAKERADYMAQWLQANKPEVREKNAQRHAKKLQATVKWADRKAIKEIYLLAASRTLETGIPHQVDHIVPLQSENVRGLHWEGNLQVLTQFQNISKHNRMPRMEVS